MICGCDAEMECSCDDDGTSTAVLDELIGDGDYSKLNKTEVNVAEYNGKSTILINGTLPNGTTAPGGDEDAGASGATGATSAGPAGVRTMAEAAGWWPVVATVAALVWAV